jgi:predicted nuclease of predicted toxin-antitoxin system
MKLLFDENLSPKLVQLLEDLFPDSLHVREEIQRHKDAQNAQ